MAEDPDVSELVATIQQYISEWAGRDEPEEGSEDGDTLSQMEEDASEIRTIKDAIAYCETWNVPSVEALFESQGYVRIAERSRRTKGSRTVLARPEDRLGGGRCVEVYSYSDGLVLHRPSPHVPREPTQEDELGAAERPVIVICHQYAGGGDLGALPFYCRMLAALNPSKAPGSVSRMGNEPVWRVMTAVSESEFRNGLQVDYDPARFKVTFIEF